MNPVPNTPTPATTGTPTETPRTTDEQFYLMDDDHCAYLVVHVSFAQCLERELSALTSANAAMAGECRELRYSLIECAAQLKHVEELRAFSGAPIPATLTPEVLAKAHRLLARLALPPTEAHAGEK